MCLALDCFSEFPQSQTIHCALMWFFSPSMFLMMLSFVCKASKSKNLKKHTQLKLSRLWGHLNGCQSFLCKTGQLPVDSQSEGDPIMVMNVLYSTFATLNPQWKARGKSSGLGLLSSLLKLLIRWSCPWLCIFVVHNWNKQNYLWQEKWLRFSDRFGVNEGGLGLHKHLTSIWTFKCMLF